MINACQIDLEEYLVYELTVKTNFAAAHSLRNYPGECASLHGHTWVVEVSVVGRELDDAGMLVDFKKLKQLIAKTIEELDHSYINEILYFNSDSKYSNPTAENLARYIYENLKRELKSVEQGISVSKVRLWESPNASVTYWEENKNS